MSDRRAAIEAAFDVEDKEEPIQTEVIENTGPTEVEEAKLEASEHPGKDADLAEDAAKEAPTDIPKDEPVDEPKQVPSERAPQSWKPAEKAKWASIDPTVKQEILRREREVTTALSDTAQARQVATQLQQVLQPFMPRFQSMNAHPLVAVRELLKADQMLSTAPAPQRAQYMAKLIKDYGIDIAELDTALSGQPQVDPTEAKFEQMFQTRVAPLMSKFQQQEQRHAQQVDAEVNNTLAEFEDDTKYPYYAQVRGDMADIIELSAKKGVYITLQQAYNKAVQLDPVINKELEAQNIARRAAQANAKAQRAKKASASVGGAPSVGSGAPVAGDDRRAFIAAAIEASGGR